MIPAGVSGRILHLDAARSLALVAMASFHLAVDLEIFGRLPPGTTLQGFWWYYARAIAGSFLFLAGISLWLAHGNGVRWRAFWRREAVIVAAAAAVSAATFLAMRPVFVWFGILHSIAAASLAGIVVLRLPAAAQLGLAGAAVWLPHAWTSPVFDRPWLWWTGLSPSSRPTMDFEPFLPWVAPLLVGMAVGRLAGSAGLWAALGGRRGVALRVIGWPGRHSLAVYLLHQPVLLALTGGASWLLRG